MKTLVAFCALATVLWQPLLASATLVDNGLFTTDTETGIDWLDLTESNSRNADYVSTQFGPGGEFEGWHYASATQVQDILGKFGFLIEQQNYIGNPFATELISITSMMGNTVGLLADYDYGILGLIDAGPEGWRWRLGAFHSENGDGRLYVEALDNNSWERTSYATSYLGHWLVRGDVVIPEPATAVLMGGGLLLLGFTRRRQLE